MLKRERVYLISFFFSKGRLNNERNEIQITDLETTNSRSRQPRKYNICLLFTLIKVKLRYVTFLRDQISGREKERKRKRII